MGTKEWDEHWAGILAQRLGQDRADEADKADKAKEPEAPAPPAADHTPPDSAAGAPPPEDVVPRPASGPRGHYTATDGVGTPQPLDPLGSAYGGITTGWKVPTSGPLPAQVPAPAVGAAPPTGAMPAAGMRGPRRSTSPTLVVRRLTHQLSARDETRALDILRGKADSGAGGAGLTVIVVLSAAAAFAGTYLWTVAVRETGVLRTAESEFGAPREAEEDPARGPKVAARLPEAATDPAAAAGRPAGEPEPSADRASAGGKVAAGTSSETPPRDQAAPEVGPEVDDTLTPAPEPNVRSFRAVAKPQAEEWVELGGPLFSVAPAGAASREGDAGGRER